MNSITLILQKIEQGEIGAANQLLTTVYDELHQVATAKMARERPGQRLQATAQRWWTYNHALRTPAFKNAEGRLMARDAFRSSADFVQDAWRVEDQRRALLAAVRAKLAAIESAVAKPPAAKGPP